MTRETPLLRIRGLRKSYREGGREHRVLEGVDATLRGGERVAVVGPSGSGKSTLLNLVSGIDLPDSGTVRVRDTDLTALSERERTLFRRRNLGFVFQFYNLVPTLTVEENVLLPLELRGGVDSEGRRRVRTLLEEVGLGDRLDSFPERLSGGEQQRVAVVRAVVHRPLLVLADEPTGNLDRRTGGRMVDLLARMVEDGRSGLLLVTHSLEVASGLDRSLQLRDGLLEEGEELQGRRPEEPGRGDRSPPGAP